MYFCISSLFMSLCPHVFLHLFMCDIYVSVYSNELLSYNLYLLISVFIYTFILVFIYL